MSLLDMKELTDSQIIFWACTSLYQFTDTEEDAFELAKFFAIKVGLKHEFPEINYEMGQSTSEEEQPEISEEDETETTSGETRNSSTSPNKEIEAILRKTGLIK